MKDVANLNRVWRKASLIKGLNYCRIEMQMHTKRTKKEFCQDENILCVLK